MVQKPINMKQVKQVHQLWTDGIKIKKIVRRKGINRKTVKKYLRQLGMLTSQATAPQGLESLIESLLISFITLWMSKGRLSAIYT